MTLVVFVGPTLSPAERLSWPQFEFLPPVRRGDIDRLLQRAQPPTAIGIVDGVFFQSLAVSPKEILRALDAGTTVYGASSMGALRAVECGQYGMIGVGRIHELYRSGRVEADDEVAIVYDADRERALSEPLVNMRLAIEDALAAGAVSSPVAERFLETAKAMYFPERTIPAVLATIAGQVGEVACASLREFLSDPERDAKRADAVALLTMMVEVE